ncbi:hypothetical protein [Pullulanibacillus pueri]|uniref:Uncharacterized protein n=1 Tax=Pullulanibacillus pueri TaxID=1437324 RepID=A0A8J3EP12_9BACL|nr:hypothetical protein [Pullulanibacillus pueri]GGH87726.1 hypothetical protein GCM10007096_38400 [Pullulanibacillus pueri]
MTASFSPIFLIGDIRIGTISDASVMNLGNNQMSHFESHKKQNQGFGSITGDHNTIENIRSLLHDPDFIDLFTDGKDTELPEWLKGVLEAHIEEKMDAQDSESPSSDKD